MRGREKFAKIKKYLYILAKIYKIFPLNFRKKLLEWHRNTPGLIGIGIRYSLIKSIAKKCGDNVSIFSGCIFLHPEKLVIGNNVSIQPLCYIDAEGGIDIGNDVSIAHNSTILSSSHNFLDLEKKIKDQGMSYKNTIINDNVWIGAKVTILCGIEILEGAVIGAGAVVTKNIMKNAIAVGVPAKVIDIRN